MKPVLRRDRAFTLVEILLAVLILAIGLLGLGAVIPVVLREQRLGTDATLGVAVVEDAKTYLERRKDLMRLRHPDYYSAGANDTNDYRMGFGRWLLAAYEGTKSVSDDPTDLDDLLEGSDWSEEFLWEDWSHNSIEYTDASEPFIEGDFSILPVDADGEVIIRLTDRLWPAPSALGAPPRFVWDLVARRVKTRLGEPRKIQIAIFVRRIDPAIRVPRGQTLAGVLASGAALPVAIDPRDGLPVPNGNPDDHDYAAPRIVNGITFNPARPDRIRLPRTPVGGDRDPLAAVRQPGQKIVDNLGNVYTVRGTVETDNEGRMILIDPPLPISARNDPSRDENDAIRQIVYVPQVPAAVAVYTLTPLDPS